MVDVGAVRVEVEVERAAVGVGVAVVGRPERRTPRREREVVAELARAHIEGHVVAAEYLRGEGVEPVGVGRRRGDREVGGGVVEAHAHPRQRGVGGGLHPVAVGVDEDVVPDRRARRVGRQRHRRHGGRLARAPLHLHHEGAGVEGAVDRDGTRGERPRRPAADPAGEREGGREFVAGRAAAVAVEVAVHPHREVRRDRVVGLVDDLEARQLERVESAAEPQVDARHRERVGREGEALVVGGDRPGLDEPVTRLPAAQVVDRADGPQADHRGVVAQQARGVDARVDGEGDVAEAVDAREHGDPHLVEGDVAAGRRDLRHDGAVEVEHPLLDGDPVVAQRRREGEQEEVLPVGVAEEDHLPVERGAAGRRARLHGVGDRELEGRRVRRRHARELDLAAVAQHRLCACAAVAAAGDAEVEVVPDDEPALRARLEADADPLGVGIGGVLAGPPEVGRPVEPRERRVEVPDVLRPHGGRDRLDGVAEGDPEVARRGVARRGVGGLPGVREDRDAAVVGHEQLEHRFVDDGVGGVEELELVDLIAARLGARGGLLDDRELDAGRLREHPQVELVGFAQHPTRGDRPHRSRVPAALPAREHAEGVGAATRVARRDRELADRGGPEVAEAVVATGLRDVHAVEGHRRGRDLAGGAHERHPGVGRERAGGLAERERPRRPLVEGGDVGRAARELERRHAHGHVAVVKQLDALGAVG